MSAPFPLNILSNDEINFLTSVLDLFIPDTRFQQQATELRKKLLNATRQSALYTRLQSTPLAIRKPGFEVVVQGRQDSPFIKFMKCENKINLVAISDAWRSGNKDLEWTPGGTSPFCIYHATTANAPELSVYFSEQETEILAAFLQYHLNKTRGDYIEYTAPSKQDIEQAEVGSSSGRTIQD